MTGGPNDWAAQVTFPVGLASKQNVFYNYKDTVNVEWVSWAENSSTTSMQIFYWAPSFSDGSWQPLDKAVTVAQNGTRAYKLNTDKVGSIKKSGDGYFLGQWNLNFTREDRNPVTGLTLSQVFNCSFDDSAPAQTYGKGVADSPLTADTPSSTASSSSSSSSSPSSATATPSGSSGVLASPSSSSSNANAAAGSASAAAASASAVPSGGLSGGAVAGVVIAVLAAIALAAAGGFFLWRRRRMNAANAAAAPYNGFPPHNGNPNAPPPGYSPYNGPGPVMYGDASKQPASSHVAPNPAEYYNKAPPGMMMMQHQQQQVPMAQSQMYSELPSQRHMSMGPSEMPGTQPVRQELPG